MKIGDLVKPFRDPGPLVGLITKIRKFDTRANTVYVQWRPAQAGLERAHVDRWYDANNLSLVEQHMPIAYSADPM